MSSQPMQQATAEAVGRMPVGALNVVDPHPLNWLYITWNTMEEPVRTDERGHMVGAVMEEARWTVVGYATTFELAETEVTEEHWSRRNDQ